MVHPRGCCGGGDRYVGLPGSGLSPGGEGETGRNRRGEEGPLEFEVVPIPRQIRGSGNPGIVWAQQQSLIRQDLHICRDSRGHRSYGLG